MNPQMERLIEELRPLVSQNNPWTDEIAVGHLTQYLLTTGQKKILYQALAVLFDDARVKAACRDLANK